MDPSPPTFRIRLFILGSTPRSQRAIVKLRGLAATLEGATLEIVDVLEHPEAAARENILAAPTLVVQLGDSEERLVGDLVDSEEALLALFKKR